MKKEFVLEKRSARFNTGREQIIYRNYDYSMMDRPIYVEQAGITEPSPDYYIEHTSQSRYYNIMYIFEYVVDGKGYIECDGKMFRVGAGDVYFLNRMHEHKYYADKKDPFKKLWLNISGTMMDDMVKLFGIKDGVVVAREECESVFREAHSLLAAMKDGDPAETNRKIAVLIFDLFSRLSRGSFHTESSYKYGLPYRVQRYIDKNIYNGISTDGLSAKFYFSKAYIARVFRKKFGITPKQYISERRVAAAKHLLASSEYSIAQIADRLSYTDSKHFANVFREYVGISPSEYRRNNTEKGL
ncbi:MAG: AraC family transcriptional regulator [Clostridia bacterium]|nr:AraC family transcriptional regulator [Clostridia bacterium]